MKGNESYITSIVFLLYSIIYSNV